MPWWLGVLGASVVITVNNLFLRSMGFRPGVVLFLLPLLIVAQLGYSYAYGKAPKFLHVWFLGTATLAVLGCAASYIMDRGFTFWNLVGVGCIAVGTYLLVL
jgi:hypothetical protein